MMLKSSIALLMTVLFGVCVGACGNADKNTSSSSHPASTSTAATTASSATTFAKVDADKDNDIGAPYDDKNNNDVLKDGRPAGAADRRAITGLLERYYAVATAGNGAKACSMIVSTLSSSVVEDYGHGSSGPAYLSGGKSCPAVMDLLFAQFHRQLAIELPKLEVAHVRLVGSRGGIAILSFGTLPEREISVVREGHVWKLAALLDNEVP
jgi:hypothetical protein